MIVDHALSTVFHSSHWALCIVITLVVYFCNIVSVLNDNASIMTIGDARDRDSRVARCSDSQIMFKATTKREKGKAVEVHSLLKYPHKLNLFVVPS
jgi:hypothetical protein